MSDSEESNDDVANNVPGHVVYPRTLLKKFIQMYKENPCLWHRKNPLYRSKDKRMKAVSKLTVLVQQYDKTASRVHVMRKIESLRACVRREHKKVLDSRRVAQTADQIHKPTLWYYNLFSFVFNDYEEQSPYRYAVPLEKKDQQQNLKIEGIEEEILEDLEEEPQFEQSLDTFQTDYTSSLVEMQESPKQFTFEEDASKSGKRLCTEVEDEYDAIGINVAAKLRNLPQNMRILSEKLINDVLFQAQTNGLSSHTTINTPDPFKQDPN